MVCYGKKGEAEETNNKKNRQMKNLLNKYFKEHDISKSDLAEEELRMINALMYKADCNVFTISGCKGIEQTKSNHKFIAESLRIIKKDKQNAEMYSIVLESKNNEMKSMQVEKEELLRILDKHFEIKCTKSNHEDKSNVKSDRSYEECR